MLVYCGENLTRDTKSQLYTWRKLQKSVNFFTLGFVAAWSHHQAVRGRTMSCDCCSAQPSLQCLQCLHTRTPGTWDSVTWPAPASVLALLCPAQRCTAHSSQCSDSAPAPLPALCEMSPLRQQTAAQSGLITQHNNNYLVVSPATFEYSPGCPPALNGQKCH